MKRMYLSCIVIILLFALILMLSGCGAITDEAQITSVINGFFQAISDRDWDTARSYCVYDSVAYNDVTDWEEEWNNDFGESEEWDLIFVVDDINPIIVSGNYAEAYTYSSIFLYYNGEILEEESESTEAWLYLQKIDSDWKLYDSY